MEVLAPIVAFLVTYIATPRIASYMFSKGFRGRDLHKEEEVVIPEQGGVAVVLGFVAGYLFLLPEIELKVWTVILIVSLMVAGIGFIDRIKRLSAREKALSLTLAGIPLIIIAQPTLMGVELGWLYYISIPVLFMFTCNYTNMLAGLNGLEIGTAAIASLGVSLVSFATGKSHGIITLVLFFSLIAFLRYNFYPARVFPGDVATLFTGAVIFSVIIAAKIEIPGIVILLPYVIDASLKLISAGVMVRESQKPTIVKNGLLYPPESGNLSLIRLVLKIKPMREWQVVLIIYAVEAVFAAAGFVISLLLSNSL